MPEKNKYFKKISKLLFLLILFTSPLKTFADTTPPVTTVEKSPSAPNGKNGWYLQPVKITLTGTDLESGIKEINYKINEKPWEKKTFSDSLNLAPNPSFETIGIDAPLYTQDWKISNSNPGAAYSRDSLIYQNDFPNTSIKIESTENNWHAIDHFDMFAAASPFDNMSAYVWLKTSNVSGNAFFNIYSISQDAFGQKTISFIKSSPVLTGTNDWTKISTGFTPTASNVIGVYLEIGINGTGTIWIDAVNISKSDIPAVSFYLSADGHYNVNYYSVDKADNIEQTKTFSLKIDQTPPGNWKDSGAVRSLFGNDHQLYVWTNVEDKTSGLSTLTDKFQYFVPRISTEFGRFPNLSRCTGTWEVNGWAILASPPFLPGVKTAYLITPMVDFCDSEWSKDCHFIRFYAEDMAGNSSIRDMCINGPWIKIRGKGIVRSNQNIDMISEAYEDNTDGLVETGGSSISFFRSSIEAYSTNSPAPEDYTYDKFFNEVKGTKTQISTTGDLVASSGVYFVDGDYEINSNKIPSNYDEETFNQIVFVDGTLTISSNIDIADNSTVLFIVKGKEISSVPVGVNIDKAVSNIEAGIITDGNFYTAYNAEEGKYTSDITLKGIFVANKFYFQRTLQGTRNEKYPSDIIIYEPKYVTNLNDYIGKNTIKWVYSD